MEIAAELPTDHPAILDEVEDLLDRVPDPTLMCAEERAGSLAALSRLRNRIDAYLTAVAAEADRSADSRVLHAGTTGTMVAVATGQNPHSGTRAVPTLVRNGSVLEVTYTRNKAALADGMVFTVEWSDRLVADSWNNSGVTEQVLADDGTVQTVKASVAAGGALSRRFLHLKVVRP